MTDAVRLASPSRSTALRSSGRREGSSWSSTPASRANRNTCPSDYSERNGQVQKRLRRIEGQCRGLERMVDEDAYCIDVLTQISAVTRALQAVAAISRLVRS